MISSRDNCKTILASDKQKQSYHFMADEVEEIFILRYIALVLCFISCFFRKGVTMDQPAAELAEVHHISAETKI